MFLKPEILPYCLSTVFQMPEDQISAALISIQNPPIRSAGELTIKELDLEMHTRMRLAGLRFSTLGTDRSCSDYNLYREHGYVDMNVWATALAPWETAHQPTRLGAERAQLAGPEGYEVIERLFETIGAQHLGFAWRHRPFVRLREHVDLENIWILRENNATVGYVFADRQDTLLHINLQAILPGVDAAEAIAAVVSEMKSAYVQVRMTRPADILSLRRAGYQIAHPDRGAFMIKPLVPQVAVDAACRLFGIGTDRFLISWLDTT